MELEVVILWDGSGCGSNSGIDGDGGTGGGVSGGCTDGGAW